jgi:hypothetical protein
MDGLRCSCQRWMDRLGWCRLLVVRLEVLFSALDICALGVVLPLSLSFLLFFSRTSLQIRDTHTQPRNVLDALICECDISMVMNRPSDIVLPPAPIWRLSSQSLLDTEFAATLCILVNQVIPEVLGCASSLLNSFRSNPLGIWMRYSIGSNSGIRGTDYRWMDGAYVDYGRYG